MSETRSKEHPLKAIRRAGVPLVAFETSDPAATTLACMDALGKAKSESVPVVAWDVVRGQRAMSEPARSLRHLFADERGGRIDPLNEPVSFLSALASAAETKDAHGKAAMDGALVFAHNLHMWWRNEQVVQGIWNLRDAFKTIGATLMVLCSTARVPDELRHDVVCVREELPDARAMGAMVDSLLKDAGLDPKKVADREKVVDILLGASAFAAEQALAMSMSERGVDCDALWESKRRMIEQTPGLTVWRGDRAEAEQIGGCANAKGFLKRLVTSEGSPIRCILFLDEIEKLLGGAAGDMSGVAQDQLQVILTEMQDQRLPAVLFIGPPGTGKTSLGHYAAAVGRSEFIKGDTGAMMGNLVGESQAKIREAFRVFRAVSQGKGMVIATSNAIGALPPELRRRFKSTFFVDVPTDEERRSIWPIWRKRHGIDEKAMEPKDDGWTGAEIEACCENAKRLATTLLEAARYVVPVTKSAAKRIAALRAEASGSFISASEDGVYAYDAKDEPQRTRPRDN